ncbi:hypothetical protein AgCh_032100 [Apium graveolens]
MANSPDHQEEEISTQDPEINPETTMMSRLAQLLQQPVAPKVGNFKHFQSVHPPEFLGVPDPIKAQSWLREMEKAFELAEVKDDKKAQYASYYLKDEASFWWELLRPAFYVILFVDWLAAMVRFKQTVRKTCDADAYVRAQESSKALLEGKDLSWEKFTEMFLEKYLPSYMQDQLEMKFLDLIQEEMSVAEYEVKFSELSRSQIAMLEIKNYAALVQKAMIVEGEREAARRENEGRKRKFESSEQEQGSSKFRGKFGKNGGGQNQKFQKFRPGNGA